MVYAISVKHGKLLKELKYAGNSAPYSHLDGVIKSIMILVKRKIMKIAALSKHLWT